MKEYPQWVIDAHKGRKSIIETRTCAPEDWGYCSYNNLYPFQIIIHASGWKAKILAFLFRIKPCCYTGTKEIFWPKSDLL